MIYLGGICKAGRFVNRLYEGDGLPRPIGARNDIAEYLISRILHLKKGEAAASSFLCHLVGVRNHKGRFDKMTLSTQRRWLMGSKGGRNSDLSEWQRSASNEPAMSGEGTAGNRNRTDWQKIKTEYITTDTSYRKLAQKHGVRYATLQARAKAEKWVDLRDRHRTNTVSKSLTKISNKQAAKLARIEGITDKLLNKLEKAVDELDLEVIKKKVKVEDGITETTTESTEVAGSGIVDRAGLRQLTAALKDLKEIQMLRSELDRQEQEARIAKLQADAQQRNNDDDDDETGVILMPSVKEVQADD